MARKPYQYGVNDTPVSVASQFGISPGELIGANPGGYPFSTGQTINIPMWQGATPGYNYQVQPRGFSSFVQQAGNTIKNANPLAVGVVNPILGAGIWANQQYQKGLEQNKNGQVPAQYQLYADTAKNIADRYNNPQPAPQTGAQPKTYTGQNDSSFNMQLKNEQSDIRNALANKTPPERMSVYSASSLGINPAEHGYQIQGSEWVYTGQNQGQGQGANSEFMNTGFMKQNTANNTPFLNQLRWDGKKYVTIGSLLKSGQLDLQGNTYPRRRGGGGGGNSRNRPTQVGLVNFGASSG